MLKAALQAGSRKQAFVRLQQLQSALQHLQTTDDQTVADKNQASQLDPLGRAIQAVAADQSSGVAVPLTADMHQPSRTILNELRDRANTPDTAPQAQDYYQRLLQLND